MEKDLEISKGEKIFKILYTISIEIYTGKSLSTIIFIVIEKEFSQNCFAKQGPIPSIAIGFPCLDLSVIIVTITLFTDSKCCQ